MPEEKKDSKSKKAVKKITKPSENKKTAKSVLKISKEVIIEPITTNEIIEETPTVDSTSVDSTAEEIKNEEIKNEEISSDQFLKDFDWDNFEEGIETVKDDKLLEFDKLIQENFVDTYNESVIDGVIINLTDREAIIDINAKSEGVISLNEFRYNPDLKVGDKVEVLVDIQEVWGIIPNPKLKCFVGIPTFIIRR